MINMLLTGTLDKTFVFLLGAAVALLLVIVVLLIALLATSGKRSAKAQQSPQIVNPSQTTAQDDQVPAHVAAIISAVITAYYQEEGNDCEFQIRKIKRV